MGKVHEFTHGLPQLVYDSQCMDPETVYSNSCRQEAITKVSKRNDAIST